MFSKFDHVAIFSHDYAMNARFYQALFGLKQLPSTRHTGAILLSDGRLGFNHVHVRTGFPTGLNHFGIQVEDVDEAISRIRAFDASYDVVERPPNRNIIAYSAHDPDGNIFDLAQRDDEHNRFRALGEHGWQSDRVISHYGVTTRDPELSFRFFTEVFELAPVNKVEGDPNYYVTDGELTVVFIPWNIHDYAEVDAVRPGTDHLGFQVESIDALKQDIEKMVDLNAHLRPWPLGRGSEGGPRLEHFKRNTPYASYRTTDIEGVHLAIHES